MRWHQMSRVRRKPKSRRSQTEARNWETRIEEIIWRIEQRTERI